MDNDKIVLEGVVEECLRGTEFSIRLDVKGKVKKVVGYVSGKMRKNYIKVGPGDKVAVELTPYDLNRVRIIKRL